MTVCRKIWIAEDGSTPIYITLVLSALNTDGTPNNTLAGTSVLVRKSASFIDKAITGATNANPVVMTVPNHGFANGTRVMHDGVVGMTQINGVWYTVKNVTTNTYELWSLDATPVTVDGTSFGVFSGTGTPAAHLMANLSVNTLVHVDNTGKYELLLASTERGTMGYGYIELLVTGMLPIHVDFQIVPDDPNAAAPSAVDVANDVGQLTIEEGINLLQALQYIAAATVGKAHGFPSAPVMDAVGNDGTARITATVDGAGNRTNVLT